MMKFKITLVILLSFSIALMAQKNINRKVCTLPPAIKSASGLLLQGPNSIWIHNDLGLGVVYNIDTLGKILRTIHINHPNRAWKDVTKDDDGNIYIGNFGNKGNTRKDLKIYKITDPAKIEEMVASDQIISFHLNDQKSYPPSRSNLNFDIESMITLNDHIYFFTKNRDVPLSSYCKVYKIPNIPGDYSAELMDSVFIGTGNMASTWVTSASISPDKKVLALLTHTRVALFYCFKGDAFFKGKMKTLELSNASTKEAITFVSNDEVYYTEHVSEDNNMPCLYSLKFSHLLNDKCGGK